MDDKVCFYIANQRAKAGFIKVFFIMIRNIFGARELIWQLFKRDFLMTYKKSFLGAGWIVISPLVGIISWVFMNAVGVLKPGDMGVPYPAFVLISTTIWGLFLGIFTSSIETLTVGTGFITQVKFPHEALLVKQAAQQIMNFIITFVLCIIVLVVFKVVPSWKIVFFPLLILPMFFLAAGMGLVLSVANVVSLDVSKIFTIIVGLFMYITPVVYSYANIKAGGLLSVVIKYNPLTYLIGNPRDLILLGRFDNPDFYIYSAVFSFVVFMLSLKLFYVSEEKVIEKMAS